MKTIQTYAIHIVIESENLIDTFDAIATLSDCIKALPCVDQAIIVDCEQLNKP